MKPYPLILYILNGDNCHVLLVENYLIFLLSSKRKLSNLLPKEYVQDFCKLYVCIMISRLLANVI